MRALAQQQAAEIPVAPPLYAYIDGHPYMLASHAAEQMEFCMRAVVAPRLSLEVDDELAKILEEPA